MSDLEVSIKHLWWAMRDVYVMPNLLDVKIREELRPFLFRGRFFGCFLQKQLISHFHFYNYNQMYYSGIGGSQQHYPASHSFHQLGACATLAIYKL